MDFEGDGLPLVHGWLGADGLAGEYATLLRTEEGLEARRDYCGTRPLYVAKSRKWVASDHRFLPEEPKDLVPAGARIRVMGGRARVEQGEETKYAGTFEEAAGSLTDLVFDSVKRRTEGRKRVAVAFSGGLDSSILATCAAKSTKVLACSVAAEGAEDSSAAAEAAGILGIEHIGAEIDAKGLERELRSLDLPFEPTPMDRSLWCIFSATARLAGESEAEFILLGQLADELFGGYAKYEVKIRQGGEAEADRIMAADVAQCGVRGFVRDELACSVWCEPRFPFAERALAVFGMTLPASFKIRNGTRKAVLREAALRLGVPEEIARRPKKAAQYSSGVTKLLSRA
jgi:asparagine synthase (glutamine-hydrolysing)